MAFLALSSARAESGQDLLKRARNAFEYGDYARTVQVLDRQTTRALLPLESDRIDAFRMLGLSYFYLSKKTPSDPKLSRGAHEAFFDLLKQDPDYELDPFYTPPEAVAFFDRVKKENAPYLAPIRERRLSRLREQQLEEEARIEAERLRREQQARQPLVEERTVIIEREIERPSLLVALMPFGLGQFQNGDTRLGVAFLSSEIAAAALSVISWSLIELMRDNQSGRFSAELYPHAKNYEQVKYWSAGAFYALWIAGALQAGLSLDPVKHVRESTLDPSAAPAGPLQPQRPTLPSPEPLVPGTEAEPPVVPGLPEEPATADN